MSGDVFTSNPQPETGNVPTRTRLNSLGSTYAFPSRSQSPTKDNHHPYAVKTTSTGLLTRSNSSAGTPFSQHSYSPLLSSPAATPTKGDRGRGRATIHRYSKSLSSAQDFAQLPPPLPSPPPLSPSRSSSASRSDNDDDVSQHFTEEPQAMSSDSEPNLAARVRHAEALPSLFTPRASTAAPAETDSYAELAKVLGIPQNPKYWTPTNLSLYIGTALSAKRGGTLQDHILRDIQIYVIREKVNGRQFMRFSEDDMDDPTLSSWMISSAAKSSLIAQSQELRQRAIKGRIYGFEKGVASPSTGAAGSRYGGSVRGTDSLASSPQSENTCEESSENDDEVLASANNPTWMDRVMLSRTHKSSKDSLSVGSRFSTPSRKSLTQLTSDQARGRVKGMVESFESHSGRSREGSISSETSSLNEESQWAEDASLPSPAPQLPIEHTLFPPMEDEVEEYEAADESDAAVISPMEAPVSEVANGDHPDLIVGDTSPIGAQDFSETLEEPSVAQLLDEEGVDGYLHPWEEDVMGETARKVSMRGLPGSSRSTRFSSVRAGSSRNKRRMPSTSVAELFVPYLEDDIEPSQASTDLEVPITSHVIPPPLSYADQGVETNFDEPVEPLVDPEIDTSDLMRMVESLQSRLTAVEQRLDVLESREIERQLAEQERVNHAAQLASDTAEHVAEALTLVPAVIEEEEFHDEPREEASPLDPPALPKKASIGMITDTPTVAKPPLQAPPPSPTKIPKPSREPRYEDVIPEGLGNFIVGASLGIVVILVQTVLKRYTGRRS
ncbi:hypothetical protein DL93DRAFT_2093209 [Clavulina sp. PMI_390]|nr:hypothetical protein DL93DRAFT_2093209 [Clavulina sp. PMI_390]